MTEMFIAVEADALKKGKTQKPNIRWRSSVGSVALIKRCIEHPEQLAPELRELVNLKGLLKSTEQLSSEPGDALSEDPLPKPKKSPPHRSPSSPVPGGRYKKKPSS